MFGTIGSLNVSAACGAFYMKVKTKKIIPSPPLP
jgi:tRNA G18 (ribose-2'-O)-methylase SpoU